MTPEVAPRKAIPLTIVPGHWPVIVNLLAPMFGTLWG